MIGPKGHCTTVPPNSPVAIDWLEALTELSHDAQMIAEVQVERVLMTKKYHSSRLYGVSTATCGATSGWRTKP